MMIKSLEIKMKIKSASSDWLLVSTNPLPLILSRNFLSPILCFPRLCPSLPLLFARSCRPFLCPPSRAVLTMTSPEEFVFRCSNITGNPAAAATNSCVELDLGTQSGPNSASSPPGDLPQVILLGVLAGILSILTAGGNLLVMLSFRVERQLRTVSNYFLLSLAVADLLIGVISMPLYTVSSLLGRWPLPHYICDLWLSLDYTMSNASVANLLVISIDRYLSVTRPLSYRIKRTPRRAAVMIAGAWIVSSITWTPWIYAWPYIEGQRKVPHDMCYIQFLQSNTVLTIVTAVVAFYLPVTIMTVLYLRIYNETRNRRRDLARLQPHQVHNSKSGGSCSSSYHLTGSASGSSSCQTSGRRQRLRQLHTVSFSFSQSETDTSLTATAAGLAVSSPPPPSDSSDGAKAGGEEEEEEVWVLREDSLLFNKTNNNNNNSQRKPTTANATDNQDANGDTSVLPSSPSATTDEPDGLSLSGSRRCRRVKTRGSRSGRKESKNESKAAKTLSAILLAFVITWTPYNIFTVMNAFGKEGDKLISDMLYSIGE